MLFHEIYGTYFSVITAILKKAAAGTLTRKELLRIISERAFGESIITIPDALTDGTWPLLNEDLKTPLRHAPSMPLTTLQLRWLKTILLDPRVQLFVPGTACSASGKPGQACSTYESLQQILTDVEPLYDPGDIIYFDRSENPDSFEDPDYIKRFRTVLCALRAKNRLHIRYAGTSREHEGTFIPLYLEYSEKDDQFRLRAAAARRAASGLRGQCTLRMASILRCDIDASPTKDIRSTAAAADAPAPGISNESVSDGADANLAVTDAVPLRPSSRKTVALELTDERNALERALLHFSDLEKETIALGQNRYRIRLRYYAEDENEILIRILSFGPMIRVISPDSFVEKIRERIRRQITLAPLIELP